MSKKFLVMSAAIALAAVVMVLAYLSEPAGMTQPNATQTVDPNRVTTIDPNWKVGDIDPSKANTGGPHSPVQSTGKFQFDRINEKGQLEIYKGDPITPLTGGWWEVGKPEFIYNLSNTRAIRLTAQRGKLYAPAEPRSGQLLGNVVLEYFDAKNDTGHTANSADGKPKKVDIQSDSKDLQFRMNMQDVKFDRDLFRLETDGPFHMTSPQFDYVGEHLKLVYSDANRRIETLQVQKSKWLRIRPQTKEERHAAAASRQAENSTTQPATTQHGASTAATKPASTEAPRPVQFYRAVFPLKVTIQSPQVQVTCDELSLVFSLQDDDGSQSKLLHSALRDTQDSNRAPQIMAAMLQTGVSPLNQAMLQIVAWSLAQTQQNAQPTTQSADALSVAARGFATNSLASPSADDIIITWDGSMVVEPISLADSHIVMAGAQDVYVQMTGRPVRINGERGEVVTSASLDYLVSAGRLTLLGDGAFPVILDSPKLGGVLQAGNFTLDQNHATGKVTGPGVLRAYNDSNVSERLPRDFSVVWKEGLDLTFYKRQPKNSSQGNDSETLVDATATDADAADRSFNGRDVLQNDPVQISAIRGAVFHGEVAVSHPRFDVQSDQLSMAMGQPGHGKQSMENIQANGNVRVNVHGGPSTDQASINSSEMTIELGMDEQGRIQAKRLLAKGDVLAKTIQGTLKTDSLVAVLNSHELLRDGQSQVQTTSDLAQAQSQPATTAGPVRVVHLTLKTAPDATAAEPLEGSVSLDAFASTLVPAMLAPSGMELPVASQADVGKRSPIKQLIADHAVEIVLNDSSTRILAQRMVTDFGPLETQIQLFGGDRKPVRVEREGVMVTGPRVVIAQNAKTIHIPGAGMMQFYSQSPLKLNADGVPVQVAGAQGAASPVTLVNVTWKEAMNFDDRGSVAQFLGSVLVQGSQGSDSSKLSCQDLRIEFVKNQTSSFGMIDAAGDELTPQEKMAQRIRQVRRVVARDDVVFEAQALDKAAKKDAKPLTRVRIVGQLVMFEGEREQVRVLGPGSMSIEDYRPSGKPAPDKIQTDKIQTPRMMVGRGATAFRWVGSLVLDAANNDMILSDQVQMIHAPIDNAQRFQLDAGHLVADLQNTGGLGSISNASTPQVNAVYADKDVRLFTDGKQVTTDHLEYDGKKEVVLLTADAGRYTTITDDKTPVPLTYRQVKWNLQNNRFEGIEPGRGFIPLLQDSRRSR